MLSVLTEVAGGQLKDQDPTYDRQREHPNLITTPFGFDSTAAEVVEGHIHS